MKRITTTLLFLTALSATPAMAETVTERNLHSWGYVQQVGNPPAAEAPVMERHEPHAYYHHEASHHEGKHHEGKHHGEGKHHHGKHHGEGKKAHHHHHHHHGAGKEKTTE